MEIKDFSELTTFIQDECLKLQENFKLRNLSDKIIPYTEKTILRYVKLYDKILFKREKRKLALQIALDTMPHGFLWKLFHADLWYQIQEIEKAKKSDEPEKVSAQSVQVFTPAIIDSMAEPPILDEED